MSDAMNSKRPWWRKKRWRIAAALWLLLPMLYFASSGPVYYAYGRGWIDGGTYDEPWYWFYWPGRYVLVLQGPPLSRTPLRIWWADYNWACYDAGYRHRSER